ncbi:hypothetical protein C8R45DRAFT_958806 [Mycena sanguinolenta]|nr:hypothetical protein C8R45DRAFT_958806 [Mycena sanguinolenta]
MRPNFLTLSSMCVKTFITTAAGLSIRSDALNVADRDCILVSRPPPRPLRHLASIVRRYTSLTDPSIAHLPYSAWPTIGLHIFQ